MNLVIGENDFPSPEKPPSMPTKNPPSGVNFTAETLPPLPIVITLANPQRVKHEKEEMKNISPHRSG